jgi:hypothetical protein
MSLTVLQLIFADWTTYQGTTWGKVLASKFFQNVISSVPGQLAPPVSVGLLSDLASSAAAAAAAAAAASPQRDSYVRGGDSSSLALLPSLSLSLEDEDGGNENRDGLLIELWIMRAKDTEGGKWRRMRHEIV